MEKTHKSLACPNCKAYGNDIIFAIKDDYEKETPDDKYTVLNIKRTYNCHCKKCGHDYQVVYGTAKLKRYHPYILDTCFEDIKLYVSYESEFDRSYRIATIDGISMILVEDDNYPIIIGEESKKELIDNHKKTRARILNTWMSRYR